MCAKFPGAIDAFESFRDDPQLFCKDAVVVGYLIKLRDYLWLILQLDDLALKNEERDQVRARGDLSSLCDQKAEQEAERTQREWFSNKQKKSATKKGRRREADRRTEDIRAILKCRLPSDQERKKLKALEPKIGSGALRSRVYRERKKLPKHD